jgi:eukaryotic-like serine/threonine-protein kinase
LSLSGRQAEFLPSEFRYVATIGRSPHADVLEIRVAGQRRALKILYAAGDSRPETYLRFMREAYVLNSIDHPSIVRFRGAGYSQGAPYYTMDYENGPTLREAVGTAGPASPEALVALMSQIAKALVVLNDRQLVHRDLTPRNIILREGDWAQPVLIDFGLAKLFVDRSLTDPDYCHGTPGYIAPEALSPRRVDTRADLFSLGVLACFVATGSHPVANLSGPALVFHMERSRVEVPRCLPGPLYELVRDLTELEPEDRPQSARDVSRRLSSLSESIGTA